MNPYLTTKASRPAYTPPMPIIHRKSVVGEYLLKYHPEEYEVSSTGVLQPIAQEVEEEYNADKHDI